MEKLNISAIILTYNEESVIEDCLKSVAEWVKEIIVIDSGSTDKTMEIVRRYTDKTYVHTFEDYASQRNWSLDSVPIAGEWVINLDADQRVSEKLRDEFFQILGGGARGVNGFMCKTKTVFMGRWIRHGGHYPIYRIYMFRNGFGRYEHRRYHQHCVVQGEYQRLNNDVLDVICSDLYSMLFRINKWTTEEAKEALERKAQTGTDNIKPRFFGNPIERKRWLRTEVYWKLPLFFRVFAYFFYRYVLRGGFLDGKEGLIFHFVQGFYVHFITDAKMYEIMKSGPKRKN